MYKKEAVKIDPLHEMLSTKLTNKEIQIIEAWRIQKNKEYHELIKEIFTFFECDHCGECCTDIPIMLLEDDVLNLSSELSMSPQNFIQSFMDNPPYLPCPCPFLIEKKCTVYSSRPSTCRTYPFQESPGAVCDVEICKISTAIATFMEENKEELTNRLENYNETMPRKISKILNKLDPASYKDPIENMKKGMDVRESALDNFQEAVGIEKKEDQVMSKVMFLPLPFYKAGLEILREKRSTK